MSHQEYLPERQLMDMLDFTDADLKTNRDGYMSKKQRARLSRTRKNLQNRAIVAISVAIAFCVVIIFRDSLVSIFSEKITSTAAICIGTAVITIVCWLPWNKLNQDLEKGYTVSVECRLKRITITNQDKIIGYQYQLKANDIAFNIDVGMYETLDEFLKSDPYCTVYYAPFSKTILAIERSLHTMDN